MKFDTRIHISKSQNVIENQAIIIEGSIRNICTMVNSVQNKITWLNWMNFVTYTHGAKFHTGIKNLFIIIKKIYM